MKDHKEELLRKFNQKQCADPLDKIGKTLVSTFGINENKPTEDPNMELGLGRATNFLNRVCDTFEDPKHMIDIAPYAYVSLGTDLFNQTMEVVLTRAKDNPEDQAVLDEILSATVLVAPELR
ncbi:hypothetical protein HN681_00825 [archaeon]|jgi:hypothetical protein|nr:hypothetical protein [archaeon]MBT3730842.1 hypothetical protein [archaeon]MBT4670156.1 hypothetical protein [archaeon]MBT5030554.1 hypothetical protein [archaeon]MBT5287907.1 hypothetical protein [archaeon]